MCSGLWSVVSGKAKKPAKGKDKDTDDSTEELAKWETKLEKAAGEIYLAVESDQRVHFSGHEDDPKAMWESLKKAHLHQKPGARFIAYDELFSIHKADDETLMDVQPEWRRQCPTSKIFVLVTSHWTNWTMNCCVWQ